MKMMGLSVDFSVWFLYIRTLFHWNMLPRRRIHEHLTLFHSMFHSVPFDTLRSHPARVARITCSPLYFFLPTSPSKFHAKFLLATRHRRFASAHLLRFSHV